MREVEHFAETEGRRPRMLVVEFGQDRTARALAAGFADLGFDVDIGPRSQTSEGAARQAIENDVHVVLVCGDAELADALKEAGGEDILVLSAAADTDVPKAAAEILDILRKRAQSAHFTPLLHRGRGRGPAERGG